MYDLQFEYKTHIQIANFQGCESICSLLQFVIFGRKFTFDSTKVGYIIMGKIQKKKSMDDIIKVNVFWL